MIGKRITSDGGFVIDGDDDWHRFVIELDGDGRATVRLFERKQLLPAKLAWTTAAARVAKGIVGYAKATLGIDPTEGEVIDARGLVCLGDGTPEHPRCEHVTECASAWCPGGLCCGKIFTGDKTCGCCLSKKWKVAAERCPIEKW